MSHQPQMPRYTHSIYYDTMLLYIHTFDSYRTLLRLPAELCESRGLL